MHDELDPAMARRQRKERERKARRKLLLLASITVASACVAVIMVGLAKQRVQDVRDAEAKLRDQPPPPADDEPKADAKADWTHRELAAYLKQKGVKAELESGGSMGGVTYSTFTDPDTKQKCSVDLLPDGKAARELAGSDSKSFAWGRFVIRRRLPEDEPYAAKIRAALR